MKVRLFLLFSLHFVTSNRDFYVGMFKKDDLLVASDTLYKERTPFRLTTAMYGRLFKCDITYFRVVDRLGVGRVPKVEITRGGLRKKYLVLRITSGYDLPLSVNIYVGCQNKYNFTRSTFIKRRTTPTIANGVKSTGNVTTTTADPKGGKKEEKKEEKKEDEAKAAPKADEEKKAGEKADEAKPEDGAAGEGGEAAKGGDEAPKPDAGGDAR